MKTRTFALTAALFVGGLIGPGVFASPDQEMRSRRLVDRISVALRQPVPLVDLHHLYTDGPVQIAWAEEVDPTGEVTDNAPLLEAVGAIVVVRYDKALVLAEGELVFAGDLIIGGVIRYAGAEGTRARLTYAGEGKRLESGATLFDGTSLDFDETLYVGTLKRISPTHCAECHCACVVSGGANCSISIGASPETNCSNCCNGVTCICGDGGTGSTTGCTKVFAPCKDEN